jgi:hypothetical protein
MRYITAYGQLLERVFADMSKQHIPLSLRSCFALAERRIASPHWPVGSNLVSTTVEV